MTVLGPTSHSFISQRLRLHYVDWGNPEAPPLILQHGGRDHCRTWDWAAEELRKDWHVICPDLRGHGDSAWSPDADYSMNAFVYDFAQLIETLGHSQVTVVGHSLGGAITTRFTGLYPDRVRKLVNIEGLGFTRKAVVDQAAQTYPEILRKWIEQRRGVAGRQPRRYPDLETAYLRMREANTRLSEEQARHLTLHGTARNEDGSWSWKFDNYLHSWAPLETSPEQIQQLWRAVTCPVLLLWGLDSVFPGPADDGRMAFFQDARLGEAEGAGHWVYHDRFEWFMDQVKAFLA